MITEELIERKIDNLIKNEVEAEYDDVGKYGSLVKIDGITIFLTINPLNKEVVSLYMVIADDYEPKISSDFTERMFNKVLEYVLELKRSEGKRKEEEVFNYLNNIV